MRRPVPMHSATARHVSSEYNCPVPKVVKEAQQAAFGQSSGPSQRIRVVPVPVQVPLGLHTVPPPVPPPVPPNPVAPKPPKAAPPTPVVVSGRQQAAP